MYSADKIRNAEIKKAAFGGYNMDEVDDLLDEIADEYDKLEKGKAETDAKFAILTEKLEGYRNSENSIHTALLNAQRLADQTVKEASEAAGHTTTDAVKKAETVITEANLSAEQIIADAHKKSDEIVADAIAKTESMIAAAHDSVARQQMLFDKLKVETRDLRNELLQKYKRQITFVESLPDEVPFDAQRAAEVLTFAFDSVPDYDAMAAAAKPATKAEPVKAEPAVSENTLAADIENIPLEPEDEVDYSAVLADVMAKKDESEISDEPVLEGGFVINTGSDDAE